MVFQAPEAEAARTFLRTILDGKGLLATCSLRQPPALPPGEQKGAGPNGASTSSSAGAAAGAGVSAPPPHIHAVLPASPHTLHNYPGAMNLLASSLRRVGPLWFHPGARDHDQTQLTQSLPVRPDAAGMSLFTLRSILGAAAAPQTQYNPLATAAASSMGLQRSHSLPSPINSPSDASLSWGLAWTPTLFGPPLLPSVLSADLQFAAQNGARPLKSRSTKAKQAYDRSPLPLDLLPFVQISSIPIVLDAASDSTVLIPSLVICNQSAAARRVQPKRKAASDSTSVQTQRELSGRELSDPVEQRACGDAGQTSDSDAGDERQSPLLELLGAVHSIQSEVCAEDTGVDALAALASAADPVPAAIAAQTEAEAETETETSAPAVGSSSSPAASPGPDTFLVTMTSAELQAWERYKTAERATAAAAAAPARSPPSPAVCAHVRGLDVSFGPGPQTICLPITPRSGIPHAVMFGGSSLPITGRHSLTETRPWHWSHAP
jgi:hypothetical protein